MVPWIGVTALGVPAFLVYACVTLARGSWHHDAEVSMVVAALGQLYLLQVLCCIGHETPPQVVASYRKSLLDQPSQSNQPVLTPTNIM